MVQWGKNGDSVTRFIKHYTTGVEGEGWGRGDGGGGVGGGGEVGPGSFSASPNTTLLCTLV